MRVPLALIALCAASIANAQFTNPSFEQPSLPSNTWVGTPTNVPGWTFVGSAGISNGGTTWGSNAHQGSQYAFLQALNNPGNITQSVPGWQVGQQYRIRFWMARRPGF